MRCDAAAAAAVLPAAGRRRAGARVRAAAAAPAGQPDAPERHLGGHLAGGGAANEEEEEEATESVSNQAVAYRAHEHEPSPVYLLGIVVLAAFAGASVRPPPAPPRRELRVAPATVSSTRAQRRMGGGRRGRW